MKAAVIANPNAGGGKGRDTAARLSRMGWDAEFYGVSGFGGESLPYMLPAPPDGPYLQRFEAALEMLLGQLPDVLVTVGGDGTAAYAADYLIRTGRAVPLYGIGTGTANVGPIVRFSPEAEWPSPSKSKCITLGAMELMDGSGAHIAYAFNDAVIGNTFLGTKNGQTLTFDADALAARGELVPAKAASSISREGSPLSVTLNGTPLTAPPFQVAQLIAAPVEHDRYYGQSYTGLWCYTPGSPYHGAVFLSPTPVVSFDDPDAGFTKWLLGGQLLLSEGDILRIEGLKESICAIADGNPYRLPDGTVSIRYTPGKIKIYAGN